MDQSVKSLGIYFLSVDEGFSSRMPLTEPQRAELDRRLADHQSNPDNVVPWEEVRASITSRLKG
jgi:putative addiction module component (TIGR02574 family)